MFGDIAGIVVVTLLLILIDSYILCEHQNTTRIVISIGIDYAILFAYMAARNVIMTDELCAPPASQPGIPRSREKYQDFK